MSIHTVIFKQHLNQTELKIHWQVSPTKLVTQKELILNSKDARGFQFRLKFNHHERNIEIGYLYPLHFFLQMNVWNKIDIQSNGNYKQRDIKKMKCFNANKPKTWHTIYNMQEQDFLIHNTSLNDEISFVFEIIIFRKIQELQIPESKLINDLTNMLENGTNSDVVIKSIDGEEFKVHKGMLTSRSEVLKALFEHDCKETQTKVIESPCSSEVLKEVLRYIYTDMAEVGKFPLELLTAADYYQLERLKALCEDVLIRNLCNENVIETLQIADLHSANVLKQSALQLIKRQGFKFTFLDKLDPKWFKLILEIKD